MPNLRASLVHSFLGISWDYLKLFKKIHLTPTGMVTTFSVHWNCFNEVWLDQSTAWRKAKYQLLISRKALVAIHSLVISCAK